MGAQQSQQDGNNKKHSEQESEDPDYYTLLCVEETATSDEIKVGLSHNVPRSAKPSFHTQGK